MGLDIIVYEVLPRTVEQMLAIRDVSSGSSESIMYVCEREELSRTFSTMIKSIPMKYLDLDKIKADFNLIDISINGVVYDEKCAEGITRLSLSNGKSIDVVLDKYFGYREHEVLAVRDVGYQRKGANETFYEEGVWDGPDIVTQSELVRHWNRYFSGNIIIEPTIIETGSVSFRKDLSGFSYRDGYDMERREGFKKRILDKFVEGSTFVRYC